MAERQKRSSRAAARSREVIRLTSVANDEFRSSTPSSAVAELMEALRPMIAEEVAKAFAEQRREIGEPRAAEAPAPLSGLTRPPELRSTTVDAMLAESHARFDALAGRLDRDPAMLDAEAFAERIGLTVQGLHAKRSRGEVLGLTQSKRKVWFPVWQIGPEGRIVPGLKELHGFFDGDPWRVHRFLLTPHGALLGATGLEALSTGRIDEALTAAKATCDGSFS